MGAWPPPPAKPRRIRAHDEARRGLAVKQGRSVGGQNEAGRGLGAESPADAGRLPGSRAVSRKPAGLVGDQVDGLELWGAADLGLRRAGSEGEVWLRSWCAPSSQFGLDRPRRSGAGAAVSAGFWVIALFVHPARRPRRRSRSKVMTANRNTKSHL